MQLLLDIAVVFALSVVAIVACHRLRIPPLVGLLVTGVFAGPSGLHLISVEEEVEVMAEVGVVLLLFVIGLELSLKGLAKMGRPLLLGGTVQMGLTALAVGIGSYLMARGTGTSVFLGFVVALSSTAVVLKILQDRGEIDSPHGTAVLGTLIYQDIAVVPLMLAIPLFGGTATAATSALGLLVRLAIVVVVGYVAYRWVVPWVLHRTAATQSREAFLLTIIVICLGIALLTSRAGLSLALGAFLAGLIISESEYSNQAVAVILPFRDVFTSLFFVSVGMLLDLSFVAEHALEVAVLTLGILLIKPAAALVAVLSLGYPLRTAVLAGLALGQIGEFSFVLAAAGEQAGVIDAGLFQTVLATAVASMLLTPLLIQVSPRVADALCSLPLPGALKTGRSHLHLTDVHDLSRHVVIAGFGVTGRNVAEAAERAGIPYAVLEINPDTVRTERARGVPIHYGDASQVNVLRHVATSEAMSVVVAVNDPAAARRITEFARRMAPDAFIVVRTRYLREVEALYSLGADEVIADELEVSIEIFSRVLGRALVPREDIERYIGETRREWRDMARSLSPESTSSHDLRVELPGMRTRSFRVTAGSPFAEKTLAEVDLRHRYRVTVLAVRKPDRTVTSPHGDTLIHDGDVLFVIGPEGWDPDRVRAPEA